METENSYTKIKLEIEPMFQKIISEYIIQNELIKEDIEKGIKKAFESFDFEEEVSKSVKHCIERAIKESTEWGKIRDTVKNKTNDLIDNYIEKSINNFKKDFE